MILQILARCGAFFIGFIVKGQMNHDFAFGIEVNPCVIEITIGKAKNKYMAFILPPIIMYVLDYLTQTAAQTYSVTMALQPMVARATSFVITIEDIAIIFGALLAIDIVCLFIGNRRNRDVI